LQIKKIYILDNGYFEINKAKTEFTGKLIEITNQVSEEIQKGAIILGYYIKNKKGYFFSPILDYENVELPTSSINLRKLSDIKVWPEDLKLFKKETTYTSSNLTEAYIYDSSDADFDTLFANSKFKKAYNELKQDVNATNEKFDTTVNNIKQHNKFYKALEDYINEKKESKLDKQVDLNLIRIQKKKKKKITIK